MCVCPVPCRTTGLCPATKYCEEDWPEPLSRTWLWVSGVDPVVVGNQVIAQLLRDRDSRFCKAFDGVFAADDIRILTSPPGALRANAICERMIANPAPRAARESFGGQ